jgi:hypothetical protein
MADQASPRYPRAVGEEVDFTLFASMVMIMAGVFQAMAGMVAILNGDFYPATREYPFQFDVATWGWIHLLMGTVVALAGWAVLTGRTWGRVTGIILAVLTAIANFLFIPYYPLWALLIIGLDVLAVWSLAAHGRDRRGELA